MEFNSYSFVCILLPSFLLLLQLFSQNAFLITFVASLMFYGWNSSLGLLLLILSTLLVHLSRNISSSSPKKRILNYIVPLVVAAPFFFFRLSESLINLIPALHYINSFYPDALLLPAGVSFYTFQLIGYYYDTTPAPKDVSFGESLLFTLFFPQLIAGPIERAEYLIAQLKNSLTNFHFDRSSLSKGFQVMSIGFMIKTFADLLISSTANDYYAYGWLSSIELIISNGLIIYFDFLGYSLIALGIARFLNIFLTINFLRPYAAIYPQGFWRRWHITLTNWFKDYIYKPFASKYSFSGPSIVIATIIVFIFTGLWHGFALRFVLWAMMHAFIILISRYCIEIGLSDKRLFRNCSWFFTYLSVNLLWLFFFYDFQTINSILSSLLLGQNFSSHRESLLLLLLIGVPFSLLFDPYKFTCYDNLLNGQISDDLISDKKTVLFEGASVTLTNFMIRVYELPFVSGISLMISILFFSYSTTFVYFRF